MRRSFALAMMTAALMVMPALAQDISATAALDAVAVLRTADLTAVRNWLRDPAVRADILTLFREHNVD